MPEIWVELTFRPNLCYFSTFEKNWLREEDRLGDFIRAKRLQKPFWDRDKPWLPHNLGSGV
jgi:hypothetical protein